MSDDPRKTEQRIREELLRLKKESGRGYRALEDEIGLPRSALLRRLNGEYDTLEMWVVVGFLEAIGKDPGAFFARMIPPTAEEPEVEEPPEEPPAIQLQKARGRIS
jgi:hypothetical protein